MAKTFLWVLVAAAAATAFLYSGAYDFGADTPHWSVTEAVIGSARDRSLDARAKGIAVPPLDDPALVAQGAAHYAAMCEGCHLAPGVDDTEIRRGLYPQPPRLADPWPSNPARQFWVIKHGVKLSAMPAWGATHSDQEIWALVAFLQKLQGMAPDQYVRLTRAVHDGADQDHAHSHSH